MIPDAAIEAAARVWHENGPNPASWEAASDSWKHGGLLRMEKAIEAAVPAIREAIAKEIEDDYGYITGTVGMADAARIVRGGDA